LTGGVVELDARVNLDEFAEFTGLVLPDGPYETAGGFVMSRLGKLPQVGDQVELADHVISVVEVDGRRTSRIRVEPRPATDPADAGGESTPADGVISGSG
jgi:putative hemolysin